MMENRRLYLVLILCLSSKTFGLPDGSPAGSCDSLVPHHSGTSIERSFPPYQILPAAGQGRIRVILGSPRGLAYKGFLINARNAETGEYVGEFTNLPSESAKILECIPGLKNAVTHTNNKEKRNIEFDWEAPTDFRGTIIFNASFVQDYSTYWAGVESPHITVLGQSIQVMTTPTPPTTQRPVTPPYYDPPVEKMIDESIKRPAIYEGCGNTKSCFGNPDGCIQSGTCNAVVAIDVKAERYTFEMLGIGGKYVAVALSEDAIMGDDSVVECTDEGGKIGVHMSWNNGKKNERIPTVQGNVVLENSYIQDGSLYCRFTREKITNVKGREFDLENKAYFLLLAAGSGFKVDQSKKIISVGYHDLLMAASSRAKRLADVGEFVAASDVLIRVHGALMIASWIGTASVGMLMARYYKQTWLRSSLCGKDQWFAWHRFLMILTWLMSIGGSVVIFIQLGEWSSETKHASFGVATNVLTFIQPFMAALRPHPGTPRRPLFNWAHWLVGNVAHICAIITLFLAVGLKKAKLPEWMDWILVAYVIFHVVTHIILSFAGCASDRKNSQWVNAFPMKDMQGRGSMGHPDIKRDAPLSSMRKFIFGVYFLAILAFSIVLILLIVFAPIEESWNSLRTKMSNQ